jgi:hypothetical protein
MIGMRQNPLADFKISGAGINDRASNVMAGDGEATIWGIEAFRAIAIV